VDKTSEIWIKIVDKISEKWIKKWINIGLISENFPARK
jgi:hypothetical protein